MRFLSGTWRWLLLGALAGIFSCGSSASESPEWVARFGDRVITAQELQVYLEQQSQRNPRLKLTPAQKQDLLQKYLERELLLSQAEKLGLDNDTAYKRELEEARRQILIRNLLSRQAAALEKEVKVTPEEIKSHYAGMGQEMRFRFLGALSAEHAEELLGRWRQGQVPEGLMDSGMVKLATLDDQWKKLLELPLKEPQIIKVGGNLILVQVLERGECRTLPFDAVQDQIVQELKERKQKELLSKWVEELKQQARVEVNPAYDWR
jgi:hypothetical protein